MDGWYPWFDSLVFGQVTRFISFWTSSWKGFYVWFFMRSLMVVVPLCIMEKMMFIALCKSSWTSLMVLKTLFDWPQRNGFADCRYQWWQAWKRLRCWTWRTLTRLDHSLVIWPGVSAWMWNRMLVEPLMAQLIGKMASSALYYSNLLHPRYQPRDSSSLLSSKQGWDSSKHDFKLFRCQSSCI